MQKQILIRTKYIINNYFTVVVKPYKQITQLGETSIFLDQVTLKDSRLLQDTSNKVASQCS